jgi:hypothetical protein
MNTKRASGCFRRVLTSFLCAGALFGMEEAGTNRQSESEVSGGVVGGKFHRFWCNCREDKRTLPAEKQRRTWPYLRFEFAFRVAMNCGEGSETRWLYLRPPGPRRSLASCAGAAPFPRRITVAAKYGSIATRFKRNRCGLATAGADDRCSMGRCRTITGASPTLFALLCLTARLAALGGRITAFLEKRLIRSGERKILSTVTARKLNISGHGVSFDEIVHISW